MPRIAKELNLSETVFVLSASRPDCAARLRIFTPAVELPFAGHPTVGTAFVLRDQGIVPSGQNQFLLDEKIGPIAVRVDPGEHPLIWLRTPAIQYGRCYDPAACADALGLERSELLDVEPQVVSAGNPMLFIPLRSKEAVDRAFLDMQGLRRIKGADQDPGAVFVFAPTPEGAWSRMFGPEHGVVEDPATGSATGPLASFMLRHNLVAPALGNRFVSEQGTKMGRRSILHIQLSREGGEEIIEVGGHVTPLIEATMNLEGLK
jgi:trans-2,3-dihydro-3-hydroxyanthranilate isomerase